MKQSALLSLMLALCAGNLAQAADFEGTARVVNVTPRMETYNVPHQECTTDAPAATGDRSYGGSIIGGITGALLGSTVGKGNGKVAAAAVGAATGAVVGDRMQNGSGQAVQHCHTVMETQERPSGYNVSYDYQGQTLTDFMPVDPGRMVHVRVHVQAIR